MQRSHELEYYTLLQHSPPLNFNTGVSHGLYVDKIQDENIKNIFINNFIKNSRRVNVPKGSLLIFNSKIIHQGYQD